VPCEDCTWGRESLWVGTYRTAADGLGRHDHRNNDKERWINGNRKQRKKTQRHQIITGGAHAEFAQQRLSKGTRVEITGRINAQSAGEGESRHYKTVLVANEIMIVRRAPIRPSSGTSHTRC
jgi:single-stranded DNA-binding protein